MISTEIVYAIVLGYVSGSIPFGLIFTWAAGMGDIRTVGSGNIGATNVLRTGSRKIAALTLITDVAKGTLPVLAARALWGEETAIAAGLAAFSGHLWPVWLSFRGGKGVATYIGVLCALWWPLALVFVIVWLVVALASRLSSLSALAASALCPLATVVAGSDRKIVLAVAALSVAVFISHRSNIVRLAGNGEPAIRLGPKP